MLNYCMLSFITCTACDQTLPFRKPARNQRFPLRRCCPKQNGAVIQTLSRTGSKLELKTSNAHVQEGTRGHIFTHLDLSFPEEQEVLRSGLGQPKRVEVLRVRLRSIGSAETAGKFHRQGGGSCRGRGSHGANGVGGNESHGRVCHGKGGSSGERGLHCRRVGAVWVLRKCKGSTARVL